MKIHKEGFSTLTVLLIFEVITLLLLWLMEPPLLAGIIVTIAGAVFFLYFVRFFRCPHRPPVINDEAIVAPADGIIVSVDEVHEPLFFNENRRRIAIFMSGNDVHINWAPVTGDIIYQAYYPGRHLLAKNPKSSELNERSCLAIRQNENNALLIKQIAGTLARRVVTRTRPGTKVQQGNEFGFIKLGSRVEVYLPLDARIEVRPGERVTGRQTVLGYWT